MTEYRYVGVADSVSFSEEDFARHHIADQGAVEFNEANNWTAELTDEAYEYLRGQGFGLMTMDQYNSFLEEQRQTAALSSQPPVPTTVVPSEATLAAESTPAEEQKVIPPRPENATKNQLAAYAWEHYQINLTDSMSKGDMNKAIDEAEAERSKPPEEQAPGDTEGEGQMRESTAGTTDVPGHGTTNTT